MGGKVEKREGEAERRKETSPIPNIGTKSAPNSTLAHSLITRLRAIDGARSLMTTPEADALPGVVSCAALCVRYSKFRKKGENLSASSLALSLGNPRSLLPGQIPVSRRREVEKR